MHAFEYHRPSTSKDALVSLARNPKGDTSRAAKASCRR